MLGVIMIKLFRIILSIIVIVAASYSLLTKNFGIMPYTLLVMGVLSFVTGSIELQAKRKTNALISIFAGAFTFFVGIYTFITGTI